MIVKAGLFARSIEAWAVARASFGCLTRMESDVFLRRGAGVKAIQVAGWLQCYQHIGVSCLL